MHPCNHCASGDTRAHCDSPSCPWRLCEMCKRVQDGKGNSMLHQGKL